MLSVSPADGSDRNSIDGVVAVQLSGAIDPAVLNQVVVDYRRTSAGVSIFSVPADGPNAGGKVAAAPRGAGAGQPGAWPDERRGPASGEEDGARIVQGDLSYDAATQTVRFTPASSCPAARDTA